MTTAAPNNVPAPPPGCPFNAEFLPPNLRKHVDPAVKKPDGFPYPAAGV